MGSQEIVEALPFGQLFVKVYVTGVSEQLVELLFVGPVPAFDLAASLTAGLTVTCTIPRRSESDRAGHPAPKVRARWCSK